MLFDQLDLPGNVGVVCVAGFYVRRFGSQQALRAAAQQIIENFLKSDLAQFRVFNRGHGDFGADDVIRILRVCGHGMGEGRLRQSEATGLA